MLPSSQGLPHSLLHKVEGHLWRIRLYNSALLADCHIRSHVFCDISSPINCHGHPKTSLRRQRLSFVIAIVLPWAVPFITVRRCFFSPAIIAWVGPIVGTSPDLVIPCVIEWTFPSVVIPLSTLRAMSPTCLLGLGIPHMYALLGLPIQRCHWRLVSFGGPGCQSRRLAWARSSHPWSGPAAVDVEVSSALASLPKAGI